MFSFIMSKLFGRVFMLSEIKQATKAAILFGEIEQGYGMFQMKKLTADLAKKQEEIEALEKRRDDGSVLDKKEAEKLVSEINTVIAQKDHIQLLIQKVDRELTGISNKLIENDHKLDYLKTL